MFYFFQSSSSKTQIDLDFQYSSKEMDMGGDGNNDQPKAPTAGGASGGNPCDSGDDSDDETCKSGEESGSDTGSSDELIVDPFVLQEMHEKIDHVDAKVKNVNAQVRAMESKLDLILRSIYDVKSSNPSI